MNDLIEDNDHTYVSPADFDSPGTPDDDVKPKDETDLPVLEAVLVYLNRELDKCSHLDSLAPTEDTKNLSLEARWAVQRALASKLELAIITIKGVIEGINDKYDETKR